MANRRILEVRRNVNILTTVTDRLGDARTDLRVSENGGDNI
jgi:hypothetical protein